ncbi:MULTISPECIES: FadR/GntR family transcriptional regulator [unclassified Sphingomonas]|uniref:FadR/GntR family transcriptional regulator n=1 Tax=unclassified Sphingomonas TaxID=196159 RepID=UPI00082F68FA|nr:MULTISPECIES: FCD domain-containing protein [unclassified Sphingomonas]
MRRSLVLRSNGIGGATRIHGAIAHDLAIAIITGRHPPGTLLEDEVTASQRLGVSRTAYREAVRLLIGKGLISSRPKVGTMINPRRRWNHLDPDLLAWSFETDPDPRFVADLFELRAMIEPEAAALAARRREDAQVGRMRTALDTMTRETLATEVGRLADRAFHEALLEAAHNEAVASLAGGIAAAVLWTTIFKQRNDALARDPIPEHARVFDAVRDADPDAARNAMRTLIDNGRRDTDRAIDSLIAT